MRDRGSAPVEFLLVGLMLTALTLAVLQLALAVHVRTTLLDAASEGARFGALADETPAAGIARTRQLIRAAIGDGYTQDVTASTGEWMGAPALTITVRATLPLVGLLGPDRGLEVAGHAAVESVDR